MFDTKELIYEEQNTTQSVLSFINPFSLIKSREIGINVESHLRGHKSKKKINFYRDILLINNGVRARNKSRLISIIDSERTILRKRALYLFIEAYNLGSDQGYNAFYMFVGQLAHNESVWDIPRSKPIYEVLRDLLRDYALNHIIFRENITVMHRLIRDNLKLFTRLIIDNSDLLKKFKTYIVSKGKIHMYDIYFLDLIEEIEGLEVHTIGQEYIKEMLVRWEKELKT